ncbi:MAG: hypothetical protein K2M95_01185 [Clostridiales bacterium]|nr:hypothetical protein [Clostridiales bacterium]
MKNKIQYFCIAAAILAVGILVAVFPYFSWILSFSYGIIGLLSGCVMWLLYRILIRSKTGEMLIGAAVVSELAGVFLLINRWFHFMRNNLLVLAVLGSLGLVALLASFALNETKMRQAAKRIFAAACGLIVAGIVGAFTYIEASFTALCAAAACIMLWIPIESYVHKKRAEKAAHIVTVPERDIEVIDDKNENQESENK